MGRDIVRAVDRRNVDQKPEGACGTGGPKEMQKENNLKRRHDMKMKRFVLLLVGLMTFVLPAAVLADHLPYPIRAPFAVTDLYGSLNAGDIDGALSAFAEDAVVKSNLSNEEWAGTEEITALLESRIRDGRKFQVVSHYTRESLELTVEVSDNGIAWGRETLEATVEDGMIKELTTTGFRLLF
jgi:hypothetical protein